MTEILVPNHGSTTSIDDDYPLSESGKVEAGVVGPPTMLNSNKYKLQKRLGLSHGFALMVGLILGSGVFISPGLIAYETTSMGMMLIIWVIAGVVALLGSICYCELGCITRMAGGNYANILYIYGNVPAFLCCWTTCLVIDPASVAAIALTIGVYTTKPFFNTEEDAALVSKLVACGVLVVACTINSISVNLTNRVQRIFAFAQIVSVLFVVSLGIWKGSEGHIENFRDGFNGTVFDSSRVIHLGLAVFGGLWSFDGWASLNNVIEEVHNIERNLILTVITAFPFILFCYLAVNISFFTLLSHSDMANKPAVGVDFVKKALGTKVSYLMMVLVALSSYGTLNGTFFTCPRLTLSASREGHMPAFLSLINRKSGSPVPAIFLLNFMAMLLLIPPAANLNSLILLFSQAQWIMYGCSIFGIIVLRIRSPDISRPVKVFIGIPVLISLVALFLVMIPFFVHPFQSCVLFGFILLGVPVYLIFVYKYLSLPSCWINVMTSINLYLQRYTGLVPCSKQDL